MRFQTAGSFRSIQFASASAWKRATVSRTPATRKAAPQRPPIGGSPSVRRWSSQTIAGRSGVPASSATTSVTRWVVRETPATALGGTGEADQSRRHASPIAVHQTSGSCSAQPGWGET